MRRWLPPVLCAVLLSACVAVTVQRRRPRKGPVKEVGYVDYGGGEVRYSAEGWPWIVASRRRTALKLMSRNCGELEPRIVDEYARQDADANYSEEDVGTMIERGDEHYVLEHYVHLVYECRPKGWVEPAASTGPARAPLLVIPAVPAPHVDVSTASFLAPASSAPAVAAPAVSTPAIAAPAVSTPSPSVPLSTSPIPSPESPR